LVDDENNLTEVRSFTTEFESDRNIKNFTRVDGTHFATLNGDMTIGLWQ